MDIITISFLLGAVLASFGGGYYFSSRSRKEKKGDAGEVVEAKARAKEIILAAKEEALKIKRNAEKESQKIRSNLVEDQKRLEIEKVRLEQRELDLSKRGKSVDELEKTYKEKLGEIEEIKRKQIERLERAASFTRQEAKKIIMNSVEQNLSEEIGRKIKEAQEKIKVASEEKAKEILTDAMHSAATDYVAEYTVSKVKLPDEEMKGRIIGKEGRNIKTFEDLTGVNLDLDETPNEVRISCFDPIRREIARVSLEKLVADGRIQPARIEEIVRKTRREIERIMYKEGENLLTRLKVYNLPKEIVSLLGRYKFRFSYGQNMIEHTLEETKIGVRIASELGVNVHTVKLACLLHDIGKVLTDEEGSHIELGANLLRKYKFPKSVVKAVEEHHSDNPSTIEGIIVQIADSISGSRPGARYDDYEDYVRRMKSLEETALEFKGVAKAYAISAGREVRVIVHPKEVSDAQAAKLAHDVARKIEEKNVYPGTVKVTVIREVRASDTAK